jgi:hypothetical protein
MKRKIKVGTTSHIEQIVLDDSSSATGAGLTGILFNTASLAAKYKRAGSSTWTTITLATATAGTWTSGGFIESSSGAGGEYEFHVPDAVIASGVANAVVVLYGAANMVPVRIEYELDAVDYQDATRFGLSALPNAAAGANGGLPTGDANARVDVGSWLGTAVTLSATTTKPEVDVASISDDATAANNAELAFDGTGYGFTGSTMPWNAAWDAEVQSEVNDGLVAFFTSSAQLVDDIWDEVLTKAAHNVANSAAKYMRQVKQSVSVSESAINDPGAAATTTVFNTDLTEVDDFWNDCVLVFTSGSLAGQCKPIADFANANGAITLDEALTSVPADNDEFVILSTHVHPVSQISNGVLTTAMTEAYAADGATFTVAQALYEICQSVSEFAIADMTKTVKKRDGSTTAATYTLNSASAPTSITRAT